MTRGTVEARLEIVIASEAKQSRNFLEELDCFVATLLAMTKNMEHAGDQRVAGR
jgi:hypothetical protein